MAIEIERKFLVKNDGWRPHVTRRRAIRQAYLKVDGPTSVRVRTDDGTSATLTIKAAATGVARHEFEYAIPVADAESMMKVRVGAIISKVRHIVPVGDLEWEVDVFEGENEGLAIAEVELDRENRKVVIPDWAGTEVTGDSRYYNADLCQRPFQSWQMRSRA